MVPPFPGPLRLGNSALGFSIGGEATACVGYLRHCPQFAAFRRLRTTSTPTPSASSAAAMTPSTGHGGPPDEEWCTAAGLVGAAVSGEAASASGSAGTSMRCP